MSVCATELWKTYVPFVDVTSCTKEFAELQEVLFTAASNEGLVKPARESRRRRLWFEMLN